MRGMRILLKLSVLMTLSSAAALSPGGVAISPYVTPSTAALKQACTRAEADTRVGLDRSAQGLLIIKGGDSPVSWHGGLTNAYRYCRQLALSLEPMPMTDTLYKGVTQQLSVGVPASLKEKADSWKAAISYGNRRLNPVSQSLVWDEVAGKGYVAFHFEPTELRAFFSDALKNKQNTYLLINRSGATVQRIQVR